MSDTETILARTRLAMRRESGQWSRNAEPPREPGPSDPIEAIPFYPDASMDTSFSLSQANAIHNSAALTPSNRFKLPKRMLLRLARFYTDRQVYFNSNVTQVLNGYAKLLNRLAAGGETLKHESASRLRQIQDRSSALEAGLSSVREEAASEHEAMRRRVAAELERLATDLSALRGDGETRDKLLKRLGDELGALRRETFRDLARSAQSQAEAVSAVRAELAALGSDLRGETERLHGETRQRLERLAREVHAELAAQRSSNERQTALLQEASGTATLAAKLAERHEGVLGELREAVAFLRGASDGQLEMFRDGLVALRSLGESHDQRLQEASATANAAAEATRRIDRTLEGLAPLAHTAKRDIALAEGAIAELREAVRGLRGASEAHGHAIQEVATCSARHEGLFAELRDGLGSLRNASEVHEDALREVSSTASSAADATQRIDVDLGRLAEDAKSLHRDLGETRESLATTDARLVATQAELTSLVQRGRGLQPERVAQLYARFEERFRGSPEDIRTRVAVYAERVARVVGQFSGLPFLDLGCGRGELVAALREAGIHAEGIEANPIFAEACRGAGIPVHQSDLFEELRGRPDASLAGISAIQVVEHLQAEALVELLELARAKIAESGLLVLETIDVRTLYALRWFFADPTHVLPLMPETLGFYVESAGFTDVEIVRLHPVPEPVAPPPGGGKRIERVAEVVFGPQDFALIARRPPVQRIVEIAAPSAPVARAARARRGSSRRALVRKKAGSGGKTRIRTARSRDRRRGKS
jgi:O-antigen chain-terminating methyltransferase